MKYLIAALLLLSACGPGVSSDEQARRAYLGMDASIDQAIALGFAGFNAASSANIDPQTGNGAKTGTLTVSGQVDQGASANKGMRLDTEYVMYSTDGKITYATDRVENPQLDMQLKMIPTGTLSGSFVGTIDMTGELDGALVLNLNFTADLQAGANSTVERAPGTTHVTGTATSGAGTYTVDVTK